MVRISLRVAAMLLALTGCMPAADSSSTASSHAAMPAGSPGVLHVAQATGKPEITAEKIKKDIVGRVVQVADAAGARPPDDWTFDADEFRQVEILERHLSENKFTLVIFVTTRNNPRPSEDSVQVTGKLQIQYEWKDGQWKLAGIENLSFRYSVGVST
jgi:hypothetical protein